MTPVRILDTRSSHQTLGPGAVLTVPVAGTAANVPSGSTAVVMNVTAVNATGNSWNTDPGVPDDYFIDWWMAAPFHALGIVRPGLQATGYCAHHDPGRFQWASAAALNVLSGLSYQQVNSPLYFPGGGRRSGSAPTAAARCPTP